MCRQLGYADALEPTATLQTQVEIEWYWIENVQCNGNESRLSDCKFSEFGNVKCISNSVAMVTCNGMCIGNTLRYAYILMEIHINNCNYNYIYTCIYMHN